MLFYLLQNREGRLLIDRRKHAGYDIRNTCHADEWLLAKREFGFWLTPAQERLLARGPLVDRLAEHEKNKLRPSIWAPTSRIR